MIDHLIHAESAAAMAEILAPLGVAVIADDGSIEWAPNIILNVGGPNDQSVRVILSDAVWDKSDPDPRNWTITTPEVLAKGFFVGVALPSLDDKLRDLPDNACWLITDRDAAERGGKYALYWAYPAEDLAVLRIEPFFAGSRVPDRMATAPPKDAPARDRQNWAATALKVDAVPTKADGRSVVAEATKADAVSVAPADAGVKIGSRAAAP